MSTRNIPPVVIKIDSFSKSRGKKIIIKLDDGETIYRGTYILSSIQGIKCIKATLDGEDYYLFDVNGNKFMLEKDVIYECKIDCSSWR